MYAVVRTGGRQYRAEPGAVIDVERLPVEEGSSLELDEVLLVAPDGGDVMIGKPLVAGARVRATCLAQYRARKILVFKYVPKQRYRKRRGHRQYYTRLRIDEIVV
ncbi:MAG: 50S ribosomal protein L21 [Anaerolineae bacterium]|nr:50S ribosomal protein L21 [Anaerolineae bacterium]